jgi:cytochrome c-type biogenesis protein CcmH/NrfG
MTTRRALTDEIQLREASLRDAVRERNSGDLSEADYQSILQREESALERLRAELASLIEEVAPTPPPRRRRRVRYLVVAALAFAAALATVLATSLSTRQAGNSITGSISLSTSQQVTRLLAQAEADVANGNVVAALSAYEQVLTLSPNDVTALTQLGWLDFSAGSSSNSATLVSVGVKDLQRAITLSPRDPAPRLYYGIVAFSTPGNAALARQLFQIFLRLHPSTAQRAIASTYVRRLGLTP